jgi:hypothetical protein
LNVGFSEEKRRNPGARIREIGKEKAELAIEKVGVED